MQRQYPHSPDKQQDESVQSPLHGAEPDALDPHQLGGFILTQTAETAAYHDEPWARRGISDSLLHPSSGVDGHMSRLLQLLSTFAIITHFHTSSATQPPPP